MHADARAPNKRALKAEVRRLQEEGAKVIALPTPAPEDAASDRFAPFIALDPRRDLPTFPLDALPTWAATWASEAAEAEQVPSDIAAALALAAIATCAMGKAKVAMFGEPLNLYMVAIDRSGANKSGIFEAAFAPIHGLAHDEHAQAELARWEARLAELEGEVKRIKGALGRAIKGDKTQVELERGDQRQRLEDALAARQRHEEARPRGDLRVCGNVTPERLADLLAGHRAVAQLSAEGGEVFETMARYTGTGTGAGNMDTVLKAWRGDHLRVDRKNGTQIAVDDPRLTIACAAQPQVLETLRDPDGAREGRGLTGRFLYVVPTSRVGFRELKQDRIPGHVRQAYAAELERLYRLPFADGATIPLEAEAWQIATDFYREIEEGLQPGGELVDVESFASKLRSYHARFAGLLHLADGRGITEPIDGDTMRRAEALARYFLAHGEAAHGMMSPDAETAKALKLWPRVVKLAGDGLEVSERQVLEVAKGRGGLGNRDDVRGVLELLIGAGWLRAEQRATTGRPARWLVLNAKAVG